MLPRKAGDKPWTVVAKLEARKQSHPTKENTMQTKTLYDEHINARTDDPETSKSAAKAAASFATTHSARILEAMTAAGPVSQSQIAEAVELLPHQVNKRLADLCRAELIYCTGKTRTGHAGRQERIWAVAA